MYLLVASLSLLSALGAFAAPTESALEKRQIQTLSPGAVAAFKPYSYYAASAYCDASVLKTWTCGSNCNANSGFQPIAAGGDGAVVQYWYVGYDPSLATIIVGHQGTDSSKIIPLLTSADFILEELNPSLFPGVSSDARVHDGFRHDHENTAQDVLAAVNTAVDQFGTKTITTVGHSLGGALSLIDAVYLKLNVPGSTVKFYGYGLPRVGNREFADLVDNTLDSFVRITNHKDPIPIIPGRFLGFKHPSGEAHIVSGSWKACPGQDNPDRQCSVGDVPTIFNGNLNDHSGPYDGVLAKCL
ncbi:lipase [Thelephora ganbajun]|uniref:Lipase n=1 Tax=Thelephora ganbajun TaxID=370292 RepID=A0ACB6ZA94_THEGA|nr:lipase [Thelephora ganbajun]